MNKLFFAFVVSVVLAGCGSTVPLSDVPVTDASVKSVTGADASGAGAGSMGAGSSGVVPVDLTQQGATSMAVPAEKRTIYFDYDSFVVKPEFQSLITENARLIKAQTGHKVVVEGHTDERGGREYNLALGQKRAEAVVGALTVLGVPANQLEAVSFGKEKPATQGNDESAFAKNRRAEIRYK